MKRLTEEERAIRKLERAAYQKEYRQKNKEKRKAYLEANREKIKRQHAEWAAQNADHRKQYNKEWLQTNKERRLQYRKANAAKIKEQTDAYNATEKAHQARLAYKAANSEKIKAAGLIYRSKPESKEKALLRKHKRRAIEKTGALSPGLSAKLLKLQKGKCATCRTDLSAKPRHLDHIIPLAAGGENVDRNIQLLCQTCNLSKGAKDPVAFMQSRGFLC
jgi:hypothetical protein